MKLTELFIKENENGGFNTGSDWAVPPNLFAMVDSDFNDIRDNDPVGQPWELIACALLGINNSKKLAVIDSEGSDLNRKALSGFHAKREIPNVDGPKSMNMLLPDEEDDSSEAKSAREKLKKRSGAIKPIERSFGYGYVAVGTWEDFPAVEISDHGYTAICIDAKHVKEANKLLKNYTDAED